MTRGMEITMTSSNTKDKSLLHGIAGTALARMPAGGWLRDISAHENWRTTTIVQRHRDRATQQPHT